MIKDSIDSFQPCITQDIELGVTSGLNPAVLHTISDFGKSKVLLLDFKLLVSHCESDFGKLVQWSINGEYPTLVLLIKLCAWDCVIDLLTQIITNQSKRGARIGDGSIGATVNNLIVDRGRRRGELPEASRGVDTDVVWLFNAAPTKNFIVNVAECVERFAVVGFVFVTPGAKIAGEELLVFFNVILRYLFDRASV